MNLSLVLQEYGSHLVKFKTAVNSDEWYGSVVDYMVHTFVMLYVPFLALKKNEGSNCQGSITSLCSLDKAACSPHSLRIGHGIVHDCCKVSVVQTGSTAKAAMHFCRHIPSGLSEGFVVFLPELALNTAQFAKSLAMLGSSEDNTALSRALSQLAEVEEKIEQLHQEQANNDFFLLAELLSDYIRLLAIVRVSFLSLSSFCSHKFSFCALPC